MVVILCAVVIRAQQDVAFAHYWAMEPSFNPASVGKEMKLNVAAAYAMQLAGFENNPKTMYAAADLPFYVLGSYHGAGIQLINDDIGLFSHKRLGLQYALKKAFLGGTLSAGVQFTLLSESFKGSKVDVIDTDDRNVFCLNRQGRRITACKHSAQLHIGSFSDRTFYSAAEVAVTENPNFCFHFLTSYFSREIR